METQDLSEETRAGAKETAFHARLRQGMLMEGQQVENLAAQW